MNRDKCTECGERLSDSITPIVIRIGLPICEDCQQRSVDHMHELLFQQEYDKGEWGSDPHFIACGVCGSAIMRLSSGTGCCDDCGSLQMRDEKGNWYAIVKEEPCSI